MSSLIAPAMCARIQAELDAIERENAVEILLAVESGSRAWGFPSRDSDYDVRFLYLRPIERYLAVIPPRDVIERPVDAVLDVNGWDLRKALQLMLRSNAVLIEWLRSPVRYRDWNSAGDLLTLASSAARLTTLIYHYQHQARRSFDAVLDGGEAARAKSYCYALRSALAIRWICDHDEAPPMDVGTLMAGLSLKGGLIEQLQRLIAEKAAATEDALMPRSATFDEFITHALSIPIPRASALASEAISARADAFLATLLLHQKNDSTGAPSGSP